MLCNNIFPHFLATLRGVGVGDCFDFAEIRPSKNVTSGRVTHPAAAAAASFALLLRNFGGISVSFVLPDNDSAGAATQSEGRNPQCTASYSFFWYDFV